MAIKKPTAQPDECCGFFCVCGRAHSIQHLQKFQMDLFPVPVAFKFAQRKIASVVLEQDQFMRSGAILAIVRQA
jgi:hypothetical protein